MGKFADSSAATSLSGPACHAPIGGMTSTISTCTFLAKPLDCYTLAPLTLLTPAKNRGRDWRPGEKAQQPRPMRFGRGFFMSA
jgi:hypothetical protein